MVTAKKQALPASKKTASPASKKSVAPASKKAAAPASKTAATSTSAAKTASRAASAGAKTTGAAIRPIKEGLTKAGLTAHLAEQSAVEPKAVKAVLAALEATVLGALHKKGVGEISLLGLVKIGVQQVPAKKRRFGKDPFSGDERWFPAKPATVKIKARALKKLKDATA